MDQFLLSLYSSYYNKTDFTSESPDKKQQNSKFNSESDNGDQICNQNLFFVSQTKFVLNFDEKLSIKSNKEFHSEDFEIPVDDQNASVVLKFSTFAAEESLESKLKRKPPSARNKRLRRRLMTGTPDDDVFIRQRSRSEIDDSSTDEGGGFGGRSNQEMLSEATGENREDNAIGRYRLPDFFRPINRIQLSSNEEVSSETGSIRRIVVDNASGRHSRTEKHESHLVRILCVFCVFICRRMFCINFDETLTANFGFGVQMNR